MGQVTDFAYKLNIDSPLLGGNAAFFRGRNFSSRCAQFNSCIASRFFNLLCEARHLLSLSGRLLTAYSVFLLGRLVDMLPVRLAFASIDAESQSGLPPDRLAGMALPEHPQFARVRDLCLQPRTPHESAQVEHAAEQLRNLRKSLGMSRSELARQLEIDLELLVAVENGYGNLETANRLLNRLLKIRAAQSAL